MRLAARIALVLLLLVAAAAIGAYGALRYAKSRSTLNEMADVAHFSMYLAVQRSSGTAAAYEEGLNAFLLVLKQRKSNWNPAWPESIYAVDTALTYARLAELARKRGAEKEAAEYTAQAAAQCPKMGWRTCTGERIAEVAAQVDAKGPFGQTLSGARE